jgi:hypothetical protein
MSTFEYLLLFFVALPLVVVWVWCLVQIVARPDMRLWEKVLWAVGILVLPVVGAIAYIVVAGKQGPVDETKEWEDKSAREIEAEVYQSSHMTTTQRFDDLFK